MTMAEQRETDERVRKAWNDGFSFGWWIGIVLGALGGAGLALAAVKIF